MIRLRRGWGLACLLAVLPQTAGAADWEVMLAPGNTTVGLTVFALGIFPRPGRFSHFAGRLHIDPAHPSDCRVELEVQVASLDMQSEVTARLALGASMLDAARYTTLHFRGSCDLSRASGELTMHGITRTLALVEQRDGTRMIATGALRRQDFGIDGLPGVIGGTVKINFAVDLPAALAQSLPAPGR